MSSTNKPCQIIFFDYNLVKCFNYYKQGYIIKNYTELKQVNIKKIKKEDTSLENKYI